MKIVFDKDLLVEAMTPALGAVSDMNTISAIEGILFTTLEDGRCMLSTYDLEKGYRTALNCQILEPGSFIINAVKLYRMIRMLPERTVTIEVNERFQAKVSGGVARYSLSALPGGDFPKLPDLEGEGQVVMKQALLKKMLSQTQHAIAQGNQIPKYCGAYFKVKDGVFTLVTCDGNRMALRECSSGFESDGKEYSFIVPGKTLSELSKILKSDSDEKVILSFGRKHVIFRFENSIFFSRLIDMEYMDYRSVIPKNNRITVTLDRQDLISCLERVSLVTNDKSVGQGMSYVKCIFEGDTLKVSSTSSMTSINDEMPIEKTGDDLTIGMNCKFFLDALRAASDGRIKITLGTERTGIVILPADEEKEEPEENEKNKEKEEEGTYLYLVCPFRMKD